MRSRWGGTVLLLLMLFALLTLGARQLSLTADEPMHLATGYAFLARGWEARWLIPARGHPPLINILEALPVYLSHPHVPVEELAGWRTYHIAFVLDLLPHLEPLERAEFVGRVPEMLMTLLLAAVVVRWATDLAGPKAALAALTVLAFDPTLLAHGRLATNDVGVLALGTLSLYVGWRWWRRPGWGRAAAVGALLAATMLAKISGLVWAAAFGLGTLWLGLVERRSRRFWLQGAGIVLVAFIVLWAAYGFEIRRLPGWPVELPAASHWEALLMQGGSPERRVSFALGMLGRESWWWYYPLAFLIKNPLPFLLALGLGLGGVIAAQREVNGRQAVALGVFPALYAGVALAWGGNVGYRHMLPLHPFLYLLIAAGVVHWLERATRWRRWVLAALALWYVGGTVRAFPNEITFFNEAVGGSAHGYRFLADSNVDWGQSFKQLRDWLAANPDGEPAIAHLTYADPARYGIDHRPIQPSRGGEAVTTPYRPPPGRYVVGATPLQGLVGHRSVPPSIYWFRYVEPTAQVGDALFVYDVAPFAGAWVAQCVTPTVPLTAQAVADGFGRGSLREVHFNCLDAWIYPGEGQQPGWYALHGYLFPPDGWQERLYYRAPQPGDAFAARHLEAARFSYRQPRAGEVPSFVLYEATLPPPSPDITMAVPVVAGTPPAGLSDAPTAAPIPLDGPLTFLGATVDRADEALEVETWWQVSEGLIDRP
ncbi:MAG: glycosyltransferase family 39 protein, partial [Anaerolineae bacterium]